VLDHVEGLRGEVPDPSKTLAFGSAATSAVGGIVGGLSGPAAPIVVPIVAGVVIGKWLYDVYMQTPGILRVLMGYIIDLTAILECLFLLIQAQHGIGPRKVTHKLIQLALTAYGESESKPQSHQAIKALVEDTSIFQRGHRDTVLEEVKRLIQKHRFEPDRGLKEKAAQLWQKMEQEWWSGV